MTQEDKKLLFQDLCARLPYGTKVRAFIGEKSENDEILGCIHIFNICAYNCKPYLRPMSSMTEEEKAELNAITDEFGDNWLEATTLEEKWKYTFLNSSNEIDWLNAHHFDYRGLIEKGLALEAPKGMYSTK